ncbi:MAG: glycosyltransferase [Acidobacteriia bacterium]|nr:glycosyltransferase [Terriglobia bacterium]
MKILWVNSGFLHPTTKGGHIRTLEMLKELHRRHEIHYVAFADSAYPEGVERSGEYCTRAYPVPNRIPLRGSPAFAGQMIANLLSSMPLPVSRYQSAAMADSIRRLRNQERFDAIVCDFLFPSANFDSLENCVLFEHNLETAIWERQAGTATNPFLRAYFGLQARRMFVYEREVCRKVAQVIAVSPADAEKMRKRFDIQHVTDVPTGVDVEHFSPPDAIERSSDLVFIGSMDWMPNIDGVCYFVEEIFPIMLAQRPSCTLAIVGRRPAPKVKLLAERNPNIRVTGTVPDIRPHLWGSLVSIVPLRIGSGTRLKIYESMAANVAVVSTSIGSEGLEIHPPEDIRIADDPRQFARQCLELLEDAETRGRVAEAGRRLVSSRFSWAQVTRRMEDLLTATPAGHALMPRKSGKNFPKL